MRKQLVLLLILFWGVSLQAQHYHTALGLRVGTGNLNRTLGLTLQQRVLPKVTLEGIAQTDFLYSATFHVLGKHHTSILTDRLNFFWGGGMSFGWEPAPASDGLSSQSQAGLGLDLMAGLELTLARVNISLDYKPNISLSNRSPWLGTQVGVSVRPVLLTEQQVKKRKRARTKEKRRREREKTKGEDQGTIRSIDWWPFD